jgi:hypothetical protein
MAVVLALLALFIFPWQFGLVAILGAALVTPLAGAALGLIADIVYYVPGAAFLPYFTFAGIASTCLSLFVHRFVKTRIMER